MSAGVRTGRASIGDRQLVYETVGEGRPLVLLHAFPLDGRMWRTVAAALASRRQVISPDLRGFGHSSLGRDPFSVADLADDVAALLDTLGIERVALGGLSLGGYVALAFAQRHRERLAALVLADTRAGADSSEARQGRSEAISLVRGQGVAALVAGQLARLLSTQADPAVVEEVRSLGKQRPEAVIACLEALRDRPDRRAELVEVAVPTLVLVGEHDALTPPDEARTMAVAIPGARLEVIPAAGHLSSLENPRAFAAALADVP